MNFLYPGFLFAFAVLLLPILIHLFNFQKFQRIYFSNVRFLKQISQETESRSKLKKLLLLLCRLLALSALVLAFAQPFLMEEGMRVKNGQKVVSVYLDNSFSMQSEGQFGNLFELGKKKAREVVNAFGNSDRFQILTNDFEGKHQRLVNKEQALELIDELKLTASFKTMHEVYLRQKEMLLSSDAIDKRIYQLSDLQKTVFSNPVSNPDTSIFYNILPIQSNVLNNVFIDSLWFSNPLNQIGLNQTIFVQIQNNSDRDLDNTSLKFFMNSMLISSASFSVDAHKKVIVPIVFLLKSSGIKQCKLSIEDYPVTYDDDFYFSLRVSQSVPVLVINSSETKTGSAFQALFSTDSLFSFTETSGDKIDFSQFSKNDFIVVNGLKEISTGLGSELKKFRDAGGSVVFFPSLKGQMDNYNSFLASMNANGFSSLDTSDTRVERVENENAFYEGVFDKRPENVDLPKLFSRFKVNSLSRSSAQVLMRLMDGTSFLSLYPDKGNFYVCCTSLDEEGSNFLRHALFVPSLIKMAIYNRKSSVPYYTCGIRNSISLKSTIISKDKPLRLISSQNKEEFIPEQQISAEGITINTSLQPSRDGNYEVKIGEEIVDGLSFNYSRSESDLSCFTKEELKELISTGKFPKVNFLELSDKSLSSDIRNATYGEKIWKVFLIFAILFFCIEIVLIRFLK